MTTPSPSRSAAGCVWVEVPFEVQKPQAGLRVDAYLAARLQRYSRSEVQRLIAEGRVSFRGARPLKPASRVADGDTVVIRYPGRVEAPSRHESLPVLHEDDELLAVNKPGDILSHPSSRVVANTATAILKKQYPRAKLHLGHRLDRETSGVLLLAKTPAAARDLFHQFFNRLVRKRYLAIVAGKVAWERKKVDVALGGEGGEIRVRQAAGGGQHAVTDFERLAANDAFSLVAAEPRTGRLHQIRVHLAHLGHSVIGDRLYTGKGELYLKTVDKKITPEDLLALGAERQMLHAHQLTVRGPASGELVTITAPPPADFLACLRRTGLPPSF